MASALEDTKAFTAKIAELATAAKNLVVKDTESTVDGSEAESVGFKPVGPSKDKEEAATRAREHNYPAPEAYDYANYKPRNPDEPRPAGPAEITDRSDADKTWASGAAKYEWMGEFGDVPPRNEALENELFKNIWAMQQGDHMKGFDLEVHIDGEMDIRPVVKFFDCGLHPVMLENVFLCGYTVPTPIQAYCIPAVLTGHDVIAVAQTGSGKTGAYLIPILSKLMGKYKKLAAPRPGTLGCTEETVRAEPLVLIIAPTRELATQIFDQARKLCYRTMLRPCVIYGGGPTGIQREELMKGCDVLIATPGRLKDFMNKPHILSLRRVKYTVLDEADELLQPDWEDELQRIMAGGDANEDADHTYLLFSATFNKESRRLAREHMSKDVLRIRVGRAGSSHGNVAQQIVFVDENRKRDALYDILFTVPPARTLIFVNSKSKADLIDDFLYNKNLPSTSMHADRTQREREDALVAFRTGKAPILVTTGVAARGIDIKNVMHIINFDLPSAMHGGIDEYVHRIGRTARIGNEGLATSFYNERNDDLAKDLVKILIESNQPVPDFLSQYAPEDNKVVWDDNTDDEASENGDEAKSNVSDTSKDSDKGNNSEDDAVSVKQAEPEVPTVNKWATDNDDAATDATPSSNW